MIFFSFCLRISIFCLIFAASQTENEIMIELASKITFNSDVFSNKVNVVLCDDDKEVVSSKTLMLSAESKDYIHLVISMMSTAYNIHKRDADVLSYIVHNCFRSEQGYAAIFNVKMFLPYSESAIRYSIERLEKKGLLQIHPYDIVSVHPFLYNLVSTKRDVDYIVIELNNNPK